MDNDDLATQLQLEDLEAELRFLKLWRVARRRACRMVLRALLGVLKILRVRRWSVPTAVAVVREFLRAYGDVIDEQINEWARLYRPSMSLRERRLLRVHLACRFLRAAARLEPGC